MRSARLGRKKGDDECVSPLADVRRSGGILGSGDRGLIAAPTNDVLSSVPAPLAFLCVPVRKRSV